MNKKLRLSFMVVGILGISVMPSSADSMKTYANGVTFTKISGSEGNGGSLKMNFPQMTIQPVTAKAPSFKAGCGGIDIAFGSLQFLDKEKIVQFLEATLSNAAGVAFDLAMKAACEECSETLKSLEAMANAINNMSLDSCQAATSLMSATGLGQQAKTNDGATNWIKTAANNVTGYLDDGGVQGWLDGLGANAPKMAQFLKKTQTTDDSFVHYLLKSPSHPLNAEEDFLRSLSGDIILGARPAGENMGTFNHWNTTQRTNAETIIAWRIGGKGTESLNVKYLGSDGNEKTDSPLSETQLITSFEPKIEKILDNILNKRAHTSEDLEMLNGFSAPVYRVFNMLSQSPETRGMAYDVKDSLVKMFAAQAMYEYVVKYQYLLLKEKSSFMSLDAKAQVAFGYDDVENEHTIAIAFDSMIEKLNNALSFIVELKRQANNEVSSELILNAQQFEAIDKIKRSVLMQRNPDFYSNIQMVKSLSLSQ